MLNLSNCGLVPKIQYLGSRSRWDGFFEDRSCLTLYGLLQGIHVEVTPKTTAFGLNISAWSYRSINSIRLLLSGQISPLLLHNSIGYLA